MWPMSSSQNCYCIFCWYWPKQWETICFPIYRLSSHLKAMIAYLGNSRMVLFRKVTLVTHMLIDFFIFQLRWRYLGNTQEPLCMIVFLMRLKEKPLIWQTPYSVLSSTCFASPVLQWVLTLPNNCLNEATFVAYWWLLLACRILFVGLLRTVVSSSESFLRLNRTSRNEQHGMYDLAISQPQVGVFNIISFKTILDWLTDFVLWWGTIKRKLIKSQSVAFIARSPAVLKQPKRANVKLCLGLTFPDITSRKLSLLKLLKPTTIWMVTSY